jgi:membrane-bound metal-dependent hydrolase YbcI (DUF457 family)
MFVGHLAVALATKRAAPRIPLAMLVGGSFGLDLLWPILLLAGVESVRVDPGNTAFTPLAFDSYPWSHSLAMALLWGAVVAAMASTRLRAAGVGVVVGATVVSHWVLDFVTHRPDLPLWPGGPKVGLDLWNSVPGTIIVEGTLFVVAIEAYRRGSRARDRVGWWSFWTLIAVAGAVWLSGPWAPPPPSADAVAVGALALWLFPIWAAWIERHRTSATGA